MPRSRYGFCEDSGMQLTARRSKMRLALVSGSGIIMLFALVSPALACSLEPSPPLVESVESGETWDGALTGVTERQVIVHRPGFLFFRSASVSMPTRSWGEPASDLSARKTGGGFAISGTCHGFASTYGDRWYVTQSNVALDRIGFGPLSASDLSVLEQNLGPTTVVPLPRTAVMAAALQLYYGPIILATVLTWMWSRRRKRVT